MSDPLLKMDEGDTGRYEDCYWEAVKRMITEVFQCDGTALVELRAEVLAMPWHDRRLFYNTEPVEIAAELSGVALTDELTAAARALASRLWDASQDVTSTTRTIRPNKDPLDDMLARIRDRQLAGSPVAEIPASKLRTSFLEVLKREGYVREYSEEEMRRDMKNLKIELRYHGGDPVIL